MPSAGARRVSRNLHLARLGRHASGPNYAVDRGPQGVRLGRTAHRTRPRARAEDGRSGERTARPDEGRADEARPDGELPRRGAPRAACDSPSASCRRTPRRCHGSSPRPPCAPSSASRPDELFVEWDPDPIAAASIGQVHRAVWLDPATGEERAVAVKIQYPGVDAAISSDLATADFLGTILKQGFGGLDPEEMVSEIKERIVEELDYEREARNQRSSPSTTAAIRSSTCPT